MLGDVNEIGKISGFKQNINWCCRQVLTSSALVPLVAFQIPFEHMDAASVSGDFGT